MSLRQNILVLKVNKTKELPTDIRKSQGVEYTSIISRAAEVDSFKFLAIHITNNSTSVYLIILALRRFSHISTLQNVF